LEPALDRGHELRPFFWRHLVIVTHDSDLHLGSFGELTLVVDHDPPTFDVPAQDRHGAQYSGGGVEALRPSSRVSEGLIVPVEMLVRGRAQGVLDPAVRRRVVARVRAALRALDRARSSATLVFTDDDEIRVLNRDYRKHDRATDVLSFHLQELAGEDDPAGDGIALGDVVISVETARRRAHGRRLGAELERLAVHGLCHLFGHDHKKKAEATVMFALERRLRRLPIGP